MLNYFFTIKSHIIDLFMMGRFMQHRFEIDVVPFMVGVVPLAVGDGGDGDPHGGGSELLMVVLVNQEYAQLFLHHQISHYRFIYDGKIYAAQV